MDISSIIGEINYIAVLLAAIAGMVWGSIWYARPVMGSKWMELTGMSMDDESANEGMGGTMVGSFVMMLIQAFVLALALHNVAGVVDGAFEGLVLGLGFGFTAIAIAYMYQMKSKTLVWIDGLFTATSLAVMGFVIGLMG